jgi:hypothetical protein
MKGVCDSSSTVGRVDSVPVGCVFALPLFLGSDHFAGQIEFPDLTSILSDS